MADASTSPTRPPGDSSPKVSAPRTIAGAALVLVGIPMLVLPGPGILAIGGGVALMARGLGFRVGHPSETSAAEDSSA